MENDVLNKKLVDEVSASREALLDAVDQLVRAEIPHETQSLVEAQAKTQHQVAELHTQQDELRVRLDEVEKELEAEQQRNLRARNEVQETRESLSQAERVMERLRQEAALAAANALPPAQALSGTCVGWHRLPGPTKARLTTAQPLNRDVVAEALAKDCQSVVLRNDHLQLQQCRDLAKAVVIGLLREPRLAARKAAMLLGTMRIPRGHVARGR